jgi:hypothetical protein
MRGYSFRTAKCGTAFVAFSFVRKNNWDPFQTAIYPRRNSIAHADFSYLPWTATVMAWNIRVLCFTRGGVRCPAWCVVDHDMWDSRDTIRWTSAIFWFVPLVVVVAVFVVTVIFSSLVLLFHARWCKNTISFSSQCQHLEPFSHVFRHDQKLE